MPAGLTLAAGALCLLAAGRAAAKSRHPVRSVLAGAVCGLGALAALALLAPWTGVALPLNRFTGFVAVVLGAPGVVLLLLLNLLFL